MKNLLKSDWLFVIVVAIGAYCGVKITNIFSHKHDMAQDITYEYRKNAILVIHKTNSICLFGATANTITISTNFTGQIIRETPLQ